MPRFRKLPVKTVESLDFNDLPDDFCRVMWLLLQCVVDKRGVGIDNPAWVRSKVFPLREDLTLEQVNYALVCYENRGMIVREQVQGRAYFWMVHFEKYQGDTSKEAESDYPDIPELVRSRSGATLELVESKSGVTQELVTTNSCSDADADAEADANTDAAAAVQDSAAACIQTAEEYGLDPEKVPGLVAQYGPETVLWNIEEVQRQVEEGRTKIGNPPGLVMKRLQDGRKPPARASPKTAREIYVGDYEGIQT